ncbi:MAG: sigma-70 family RNA polymerase sigma factor [Nitrospira sp.]
MTTPKKKQTGLSSNAESVIHRLAENQSLFEAFLRRRVEDDFIVQDLLQQSLVKAIQQQHSLNNEESVVPWFYRILRNTVIDYYRSKASEKARRNDFLEQAKVLADDHVPSLDEVKSTVCRCLDDAISVLRPGYSELIRRIDLAGETVSVVAKDLQITPNNATVRLHRARQALRQSLELSCGVCSTHGCINCTCKES